MKKYWVPFFDGLVKNNPTFVLLLGMCPTLAVTSNAINGFSMGLSTTAVLLMSNVIISLLRKVIPDGVRIPSYIVIVASLVSMVQLLLQAYVPAVYEALGIYIPLIVVNCIILGRAEAYANRNTVGLSFFDGLGMGLGFTAALTAIGLVRELLGNFSVFGISFAGVMPEWIQPISLFVMAPGAFLTLAFLIAAFNKIRTKKKLPVKREVGCNGHCADCSSASPDCKPQ